MPVPTSLAQIDRNAALCPPLGTETAKGVIDDYFRACFSLIAQCVMPIGAILPFHGDIALLGSEWKLCDGSNGTPDLRGKTILGTSTAYANKSIGGSANPVIPSHRHSISNQLTDVGGEHTHTLFNYTTGGSYAAPIAGTTGAQLQTGQLSGNSGIHQHHINGMTELFGNTDSSNGNLPPYMALNWIMRVS